MTGVVDAIAPQDAEHARYDVALSYAGAQREYVEQVAAALQARGVRCFFDADEQVELWGRCLPEELARVYAEDAATVVVFVSAEYARRDWTRLERRAALDRAVRERREYVLPARFDDTVLPGLLSGLVTVDLRGRSPQEFADLLAGKLAQLGVGPPRRRSPEGAPDPRRESGDTQPGVFPAVWKVPPRLATFTGREELLDEIHSRLTGGGPVAVTALYGLGGVGKTQLAVEYAHRHAGDYTLVWWVDAERVAVLAEQVAALAPRLGLPAGGGVTEDAAAVLDALRRRRSWLLVFDNAEDPATLGPWLPGGTGHVLITSRTPTWSTLATPVDVDVLGAEEAVHFLLRTRIPDLDPGLAAGVATELGRLPLALAQAAAYLEQTRISPSTYLHRFRTRRAQMLAKGNDLAYGGTVDTAWSLALDRLGDQAPAAVQLLDLAACCGPAPIPLALFADRPERLPPPLGPALSAGPDPAAELDEVAATLLDYSLARRDGDSLLVHRLVQAVTRYRAPSERHAEHTRTIRALLAAFLPPDAEDPAHWPSYASLLPHLLAAPALHPQEPGTDTGEAGRQVLVNAGRYLYNRGDYEAARDLSADLMRRWARDLGHDDHLDVLAAGKNLASALVGLGDYEKAEHLHRDVYERRQRVLGSSDMLTLYSASDLADTLRLEGKFQEAHDLNVSTRPRLLAEVGRRHPYALRCANNLANDLFGLGLYSQARELDEQTFRLRSEVLGPVHPYTLASAANLATDLYAEGDPDGARNLLQSTYDSFLDVLGRNHPDVLAVANNLAVVLYSRGQEQEARERYQETWQQFRRVLGERHPHVGCLAENLRDGSAARIIRI